MKRSQKFGWLAVSLATLVGWGWWGPINSAKADQNDYGSGLIRRGYEPLSIEVWTDREDYYIGGKIKVFFRTNQDAYVALYDIDTDGYLHLLFPYNGNDRRFVQGGVTYRIPDKYDDYSLWVEGPPGIEYVQAVASLDPFPLPSWPGYQRPQSDEEEDDYDRSGTDSYGSDYRPGERVEGDPADYLDGLVRRVVPIERYPDRCAVDLVTFHVLRPYYYSRPYPVYDPYAYDPFFDCGFVYIGYPVGSEVFIDGIFFGYAPIYVPRVTVGFHVLYVRHSGFDGYSYRLNVRRNQVYRFKADSFKDWKPTRVMFKKSDRPLFDEAIRKKIILPPRTDTKFKQAESASGGNRGRDGQRVEGKEKRDFQQSVPSREERVFRSEKRSDWPGAEQQRIEVRKSERSGGEMRTQNSDSRQREGIQVKREGPQRDAQFRSSEREKREVRQNDGRQRVEKQTRVKEVDRSERPVGGSRDEMKGEKEFHSKGKK